MVIIWNLFYHFLKYQILDNIRSDGHPTRKALMHNNPPIFSDASRQFQDFLSKMAAQTLKNPKQSSALLKATWLHTPLGAMLVIADEAALYRLDFLDTPGLLHAVNALCMKTYAALTPGITDPIKSLTEELCAYFTGELTAFKASFHALGSPFQQHVWRSLLSIPYGQAWSYKKQAEFLGKSSACRAVANANGANPLSIIIPCHRVIRSGGSLGGYGGGLSRKQWLIEHEKSFATSF